MKKDFDPMSYIESAFLDTRPAKKAVIEKERPTSNGGPGINIKLKTTAMHAPRPRKRKAPQETPVVTEGAYEYSKREIRVA